MTPKMASDPMTMNAQMANTLMEANQNSASAKKRTDKAFRVKMSVMHAALHTHVGLSGNHRCMSRPAAVNSEPRATVQVSQYWIAITKPVPGPMNFSAYTWKEPVTGMATESSPSVSMTR